MCSTNVKLRLKAVLAITVLALLSFASKSTFADERPFPCNANRSSLAIVRLNPVITNGQTAVFHIDYENQNTGGAQDGCDVTITNTCFFCYKADGTVDITSCQPMLDPATLPVTIPFPTPAAGGVISIGD